ncbi:MAG TPA: long-chain fatty acid--CoA ligase [Candidatus Krumholzibacteria bacterium]|nr:long-chain fatty acid--CoA ligase [Candidatus Krumholzibacteria bacterium]HPD72136.1 long-chain fatty acid--CoA ligase [Candidatus Krumholzibacteria bacterium]HRY40932.1 long-chain fatty acid--CoA ligase [Candidatus Krumholzibacteria bacterium]
MPDNLPAMLADRARALGDHPALRARTEAGWRGISYREMDRSVQAVARGLLALGVRPGDRVGIMAGNRPDWSIADFGILRAQGVVVPLYPTSTAAQVGHIVRDAGIAILFAGGAPELAALRDARRSLPELRHVLVFDWTGVDPAPGETSFAEWATAAAGLPGDDELARRQAAIQPRDLATIIYTSGTTGEPKGVMLSHANIFHQIRAVNDRFTVGPDDRSLCFLPLSHCFERTWTYYILHQGATNYYLQDPKRIVPAMAEVKPTAMTGVPRLYEKIHATMFDKVERAGAVRRRIFGWALRIGREFHERRLRGRAISPWLRWRYALADQLALKRIRAVVGGPKNFFAAGGAALAREIEETFLSAGLLVCQGYGLTETSPMITCNSAADLRFGTVGRPVRECEVRIGEESEVQVRGPNVMLGYWNRPDDTAAAFTADGWLRTGDVGVLDADGFLRITDRLKDLIVTSGGKNIAPASIEMQVGKDHYIEQIAVVGDGQRFVGALILPSFEALEAWAAEQRIRFADRAELLRNHRVIEFIRERIHRQSIDLAGFERIKRFHLLEKGFSLARGEITPTLKLKRKVIQEHYKDVIARLYQGS